MKHRKPILIFSACVFAFVFTVAAIVGLGIPSMPIKDRFLAEVETLAKVDGDDLTLAGGGYSRRLFAGNAHMKFRVKGDPDRLIVVELTRSLHVFDWRLSGYSDD